MKCRVCNEELVEANNRCIKCGFNNETYIRKEVEKIDEKCVLEKNGIINKNEDDISLKLFIVSIIVFCYFKYIIGFVMDSFGVYADESTGPSIKQGIIIFSLSMPAIITQIICYVKYLKNKINVRFLPRIAVKFVYLYALNMIFFSFFGVALIWLYIMFMPLTLAVIFIVMKS